MASELMALDPLYMYAANLAKVITRLPANASCNKKQSKKQEIFFIRVWEKKDGAADLIHSI